MRSATCVEGRSVGIKERAYVKSHLRQLDPFLHTVLMYRCSGTFIGIDMVRVICSRTVTINRKRVTKIALFHFWTD